MNLRNLFLTLITRNKKRRKAKKSKECCMLSARFNVGNDHIQISTFKVTPFKDCKSSFDKLKMAES